MKSELIKTANIKYLFFLGVIFVFLFSGIKVLATVCLEFPQPNPGSCTVSLGCTDNPPPTCGTNNSCCNKIIYCLEQSSCTPDTEYTCPPPYTNCGLTINVTDKGLNYLSYYSMDKAGNQESVSSTKICIGCVIGGVCYANNECNPANKCQICNTSLSLISWSNVPSGNVCSGPVSPFNYCNYDENCNNGACSATKWWTSCNGSGSCRPASDHTNAYSQTVYANPGYSLTDNCGTTGSTLCDSAWRASTAPGDNYYGAGGAFSCQGMCNGSGSCLYAVNCAGGPTFDFSISVSPTSGSVIQGNSTTTNVNTTLITGPTESVTFFSSISPSESTITTTFNPPSCNPSCPSTTTIATSPTTPPGQYEITVCASNAGASVTRCYSSYTLTVTGAAAVITAPVVTTGSATNITQNSATLNGTLTSLGYDLATCPSCSCIVWFDWKKNIDTTWSSTTVQTMISTGAFSANISGLSASTTYDFRARAKNGGSW